MLHQTVEDLPASVKMKAVGRVNLLLARSGASEHLYPPIKSIAPRASRRRGRDEHVIIF